MSGSRLAPLPQPQPQEHKVHTTNGGNSNSAVGDTGGTTSPQTGVPPYGVIRKLGRSLFGGVYLARHKQTGALVALKCSRLDRRELHRQQCDKDKTQRRLVDDPMRECEALRRLCAHDSTAYRGRRYVLSLLGEYWHGPQHYSALEFAAGGDLLTCLQSLPAGTFDEAAVRLCAAQVLGGLQFMHACRVAHLDLKLENILLCKGGEIRIADFGCAHIGLLRGPDVVRVADGLRRGTDTFMAPEVFAGEPFNPYLADVYGVGLMVFQLLTRRRLHSLPTMADRDFAAVVGAGNDGKLSARLQCLLVRLNASAGSALCHFLAAALSPPEYRWSVGRLLTHPWLVGAFVATKGGSSAPVATTSAAPSRGDSKQQLGQQQEEQQQSLGSGAGGCDACPCSSSSSQFHNDIDGDLDMEPTEDIGPGVPVLLPAGCGRQTDPPPPLLSAASQHAAHQRDPWITLTEVTGSSPGQQDARVDQADWK